ncbi:TPA: ImmA/IrrE family metallo-endopeptidase [Haemophilus influenzae]|uniref:ImmA/IrrE family metallo-endopeptidase n=2 Tax=Haemophilus influenzae TaxID=727 RepID=UPI00014FCA6E|nr:ImmA/IrrE family metallo-endopeptidase [Haemophilus influenzae]EDK09558.1 hypothetical protein CGSHiHH_00613 [Haemophilus influenzae PittHH]AXP37780.1 ImmA/IrrE family metallo-endopeptidase [Haemophilus influenzae]AXP56068.1 ImmA/IrrE family metallo-endopeptidase [Haemophilus influenzae]AXP66324.1 ImmA/IrrE family metallo-endopeptidase [Haemophilus influenzae]AYO34394.1 ImmA/IrrE family metallo-endopeptidase [Haemophilus influenzae]
MSSIFYNDGFSVSPMSKKQIDSITQAIREIAAKCGWVDSNGAVDIVSLLEFGYEKFRIIPDHEMAGALGLTLPTGEILLRESVYNGACYGNGRDRFTVAHELAHGVLHKEQIGFARPVDHNTKIYCNAEWQANEFAGRLLLPDSCIKQHSGRSISEIAGLFQISYECAEIRISKYRK